jgi:hypothetical protein
MELVELGNTRILTDYAQKSAQRLIHPKHNTPYGESKTLFFSSLFFWANGTWKSTFNAWPLFSTPSSNNAHVIIEWREPSITLNSPITVGYNFF